jgi:nicotinate-nucleotide adenylyltransferase
MGPAQTECGSGLGEGGDDSDSPAAVEVRFRYPRGMAQAAAHPDEILKEAEPPLVFCPLGFERRAFLRFGKLPVVTTGPGTGAIGRAFAERDRWPVRNPRLVILVGLAGALDPQLRPGEAFAVTRVVLDSTNAVESSLAHRDRSLDRPADDRRTPTSVVESNAPAIDAAAKTRLRTETGADLVDTESRAFATCASSAGLAWAIVRGVSDGAGDALPREIAGFVDARGETRIGRVLAAIARRPTILRDLVRLARASRAAMRNASFLADAHACVPSIELCSSRRPLVLFGGSFDPPHARHATLLAEAMRTLASRCAIVMPAAINPLKATTPPADPEARLAMCRAAFTAVPAEIEGEIRLSRLEIDREGPSYTVDTVRALLDRDPGTGLRQPGAIRFLVGSDAIRSIDRWHAWRDLLRIATPAVVVRPPDTRESVERFLAGFAGYSGFADAPSWLLDLAPVDLASTGIRAAAAGGARPDGLSDGVWREITARGLYGFGRAR